jgi:hypothetical protein
VPTPAAHIAARATSTPKDTQKYIAKDVADVVITLWFSCARRFLTPCPAQPAPLEPATAVGSPYRRPLPSPAHPQLTPSEIAVGLREVRSPPRVATKRDHLAAVALHADHPLSRSGGIGRRAGLKSGLNGPVGLREKPGKPVLSQVYHAARIGSNRPIPMPFSDKLGRPNALENTTSACQRLPPQATFGRTHRQP